MKKLLFSLLTMAVCMMVSAQQPTPLPTDSAVRIGHLDNGLTYYIRHNELPKQRCEFHIAQSVGAILEEDNQNGLAHFLEHMAFNGTQHFPGKGIIQYFESIGVNFGGNINAYTSLDETVYRLSDVPTYREGIIDSALLVMHDWACGLLLLPEEIDAERGVIREEWRTRSQANRRMWSAMNPLIYPGSQYAKRDVIGDTAVINNFEYDALRAYYKKWYGPDNQAIIVVGDIDVDQIEAKIKALWADVPARENRGERPIYEIADNEVPIVGIVTDKEAQFTRIRIDYKKAPTPKAIKGTDMDYVQQVELELITEMINNRFQELAQDPDASFIGGGSGYYNIVKSKDAFIGVVVAKLGQEKQAYKDLVYQMEKVRRYGFTNAELERAKTEILSVLEKTYNERSSTKNISYTREYIRHFLDGALIPGVRWEYEIGQQVLPLLDLTTINQMASLMVTEQNVLVSFTAPEGTILPTEDEVRQTMADSRNWEIAAPQEETIRTELVKKAPRAGKICKSTTNEQLGTTEWTLSNGIKVVLKPTTYKQDEILFYAQSFGGLSTIKDPADLPSASFASSIVDFGGLGDMSMTDLQKALSGKYVSMQSSIDEYTESMSGSSTIRDLETMLQLSYLSFTAPRRDEKSYQTLCAMMETQLKNRAMDPKSAWTDSVVLMQKDHSLRTIITDEKTMSQVDLDKALKIYKERFANPADFLITITGNIDPSDKQFQKLICTWLGGLKTKKKVHESLIDDQVRAPKGVLKNYFNHEMLTPMATNYIQYTSYDIPYSLANSLNVSIMGRILDTRYLESIREREGGSYGVNCYARLRRLPVPYARLIMIFDTDPLKQEQLIQVIHEEVQTILDKGVLTTDLEKERASMLKDFEQNKEENSYWRSTILPQYYLYGENMLTQYEPAVQAISAESVRDILQQLVKSNNMFEVVMMPQTKQ